jgi:ABC-2 type transport system ATP-binding protein
MSYIQLRNLTKEFKFPVKTGSWIKDIVKPNYNNVTAVDKISLDIEKGESIAFIGPNGAGKSTTIKMLTGILYPTSGEIVVAGIVPYEQRQALSRKIATIFAQRSQLIFNLPVRDSLELFGQIYDLPKDKISKKITELIYLFDLQSFVDQPVRKLSLGQRMRAEIAISLIHDPEIIFLDEPTIGLDVVAKKNLRDALVRLNKEKGTTLFLTSHDVGDIEAMADRTIIVNKGKIVMDEKTDQIQKSILTKKLIQLDANLKDFVINIKGVEVSNLSVNHVDLEVDTKLTSVNEVINYIVDKYKIIDINIEDPALEDIIGSIYQSQK